MPSLVLSWEDGGEQRSSVPETLHRLAIGDYHCHCHCHCFGEHITITITVSIDLPSVITVAIAIAIVFGEHITIDEYHCRFYRLAIFVNFAMLFTNGNAFPCIAIGE